MLNLFELFIEEKKSAKVYPNEVHIFAKILSVTLITLMSLIFFYCRFKPKQS
jgi:hypothetical protein